MSAVQGRLLYIAACCTGLPAVQGCLLYRAACCTGLPVVQGCLLYRTARCTWQSVYYMYSPDCYCVHWHFLQRTDWCRSLLLYRNTSRSLLLNKIASHLLLLFRNASHIVCCNIGVPLIVCLSPLRYQFVKAVWNYTKYTVNSASCIQSYQHYNLHFYLQCSTCWVVYAIHMCKLPASTGYFAYFKLYRKMLSS